MDNAVGLISMRYIKDPTDPTWSDDLVMKKYFAFLNQYAPDVAVDDSYGPLRQPGRREVTGVARL